MATTEPNSGTVTVTTTSSTLSAVHGVASTTTFHIWTPRNIDISVSDTSLRRVAGWLGPCSTREGQYQTARLQVTANFVSGGSQFTGNVLPLVSHRVSSLHERYLVFVLCLYQK